MKKLVALLVLTIVLTSLFSCGPRRYKCGPYRRCEVDKKAPILINTKIILKPTQHKFS